MTDEFSPGPVVGPPHVVQFYADEDMFLTTWSDFIGLAVSNGSSALVVATKKHNAILLRKLRKAGIDVKRAVREKRYRALDAMKFLARFRKDTALDHDSFERAVIPILSEMAAVSGENLVVFGEMVDILVAQGLPEAAIELEQLWNGLLASHSFTLRCGYRIDRFPMSERLHWVQKIWAEHSCASFG